MAFSFPFVEIFNNIFDRIFQVRSKNGNKNISVLFDLININVKFYLQTIFFPLILLLDADVMHVQAQILGGSIAAIKDFPYYVKVTMEIMNEKKNRTFHCGGSIVSKWSIVTAAHCVESNGKVIVRAGSAKSTDRGETREIHKEDIIIHPNYSSTSAEDDVAVLLLKEPLPINGANIGRIKLAKKGHELKEDKMLTVSGFGATDRTNPKYSDNLQYIELPVVNFEKCREMYLERAHEDFEITDKHFCAGYFYEMKAAFKGDSGGEFHRFMYYILHSHLNDKLMKNIHANRSDC